MVSEGTEVTGQIPHVQQFRVHVIEGDRQVTITVGIQGAEKSLTPKMTPGLGRSWGVELKGEDWEGAAWRGEKG